MAANFELPTLVAIYTRKSSEDDSKQSKSHERQRSEVVAFCGRNNFVITQEFSDDASAWKLNPTDRPGFNKMMKWLDKDAGHVVVMSEVSRLSRSLSVWSEINQRLHQFRFVELGNNEPTKVIVSIYLALADEESKKISERVKTAYQSRVEKHGKGNFKWGNPNIKDHAAKGRATKTKNAIELWSHVINMDAHLYKFTSLNQKFRVIELNRLGYTTSTGRPITASNLSRAHRKFGTGCVRSAAKEIG